jgi:hypothetical protein
MSRYKCWRSRSDPELHLICADGPEAFNTLPDSIRQRQPEVALQVDGRRTGFVIVHAHVSKLELEARGLRSVVENRPCPRCEGKGEVPQHGGLRHRTCWRRGGKGNATLHIADLPQINAPPPSNYVRSLTKSPRLSRIISACSKLLCGLQPVALPGEHTAH